MTLETPTLSGGRLAIQQALGMWLLLVADADGVTATWHGTRREAVTAAAEHAPSLRWHARP